MDVDTPVDTPVAAEVPMPVLEVAESVAAGDLLSASVGTSTSKDPIKQQVRDVGFTGSAHGG